MPQITTSQMTNQGGLPGVANATDDILWNPSLQTPTTGAGPTVGSVDPFAQIDSTSNNSSWSFPAPASAPTAQLNDTLSAFNGLLTAVQPISTSSSLGNSGFDFDLFANLNTGDGNLAWGMCYCCFLAQSRRRFAMEHTRRGTAE